MERTIIIAEAGVNHNGRLEIAKELIDCASHAGADYVKFQTFKASNLVCKNTEKAEYQKKATHENENQFEMLKKLEIHYDVHLELIEHCKKVGIKFLSSPFDIKSVDLLVELELDLLKIPSGEITNLPYLRHIGRVNKPLIMSSGMSYYHEVEEAMNVLLDSGAKKNDITILQCNTEYPTPPNDVNLNAMLNMKKKLDVNIGYSDHTLGIEIPIAAVALGARVIEKHFTLDKKMNGPDHAASLEPNELSQLVKSIRNLEVAFGNNDKSPTNSELKNIAIARKSIVANKEIKKGETFTTENLTTKRPGSGISPMLWDELLGKKSTRNYIADDLIIDQ